MNCPRCSTFLDPGVLYCNECKSKLKIDKDGELQVRSDVFTKNLSMLRCPNCHKAFKGAKPNISERGFRKLKYLCPHCSTSLIPDWKSTAIERTGLLFLGICCLFSWHAHSWSTSISVLFYLIWFCSVMLVFFGMSRRSLLVEKDPESAKGA